MLRLFRVRLRLCARCLHVMIIRATHTTCTRTTKRRNNDERQQQHEQQRTHERQRTHAQRARDEQRTIHVVRYRTRIEHRRETRTRAHASRVRVQHDRTCAIVRIAQHERCARAIRIRQRATRHRDQNHFARLIARHDRDARTQQRARVARLCAHEIDTMSMQCRTNDTCNAQRAIVQRARKK